MEPTYKDVILDWLLDPRSDDDVDIGFSDLEVLETVTDLVTDWSTAMSGVSHKIQDMVLWRIASYPLLVQFHLDDERIPIESRLRFLNAAKNVTLAVPLLYEKEAPMDTGYYMWWDCLLSNLNVPALTDLALEILSEQVRHSDPRVQLAALHGLGHLEHPLRPQVVTEFMRMYPEAASSSWVQQCRDGTVM